MLISSLLQGLGAIVSLPETLWYRDEGDTSRPPLVYCCLLPAARTFQWRMGRRYRASAVRHGHEHLFAGGITGAVRRRDRNRVDSASTCA